MVAQPPRMPFEMAGNPVAVMELPAGAKNWTVECAPREKAPSPSVTAPVLVAPTVAKVFCATLVLAKLCALDEDALPFTINAPSCPLKFNPEAELMMLVGGVAVLKSSTSV